jgi:hypothetical protein
VSRLLRDRVGVVTAAVTDRRELMFRRKPKVIRSYISSDGARFDTEEDRDAWEATLAQVADHNERIMAVLREREDETRH